VVAAASGRSQAQLALLLAQHGVAAGSGGMSARQVSIRHTDLIACGLAELPDRLGMFICGLVVARQRDHTRQQIVVQRMETPVATPFMQRMSLADVVFRLLIISG
jgi:hypothetical protein